MTSFSIALSKDQFESDNEMVALGWLKIGEFEENFHASLSYWDREEYLSQWGEALERLEKGKSRSALVTSMYDPETANFIRWWPLYLIGDNVHFQEQILFIPDLEQPFDETDLYKFVQQRETDSEDGGKLSEWTLKLKAIEDFLKSGGPSIR